MVAAVWMPEMCRRRRCAVAPVWQKWGAYLLANKITPRALLADSVHPNDRGWRVIADVIDAALKAAADHAVSRSSR